MTSHLLFFEPRVIPAPTVFFCEMAAHQFSLHDWLRAAGRSEYEKILLEHGYNSYESCFNLSKADLLAAGVDDYDAEILADEAKELRAVGV